MGRHNSPNWQEKCLMIIETICENECLKGSVKDHPNDCIFCKIYKIAHVGTADCGHKLWDKEVDELWKEVEI